MSSRNSGIGLRVTRRSGSHIRSAIKNGTFHLHRCTSVEGRLPNPGNPLRSELDTGGLRPGTTLGYVGYSNLPAVGFGDYFSAVDVGDEQPCLDDVRARAVYDTFEMRCQTHGTIRSRCDAKPTEPSVRDAMPNPRNHPFEMRCQTHGTIRSRCDAKPTEPPKSVRSNGTGNAVRERYRGHSKMLSTYIWLYEYFYPQSFDSQL